MVNSTGSKVGINLDSIHDWGTDNPFTDIFKTCRGWIVSSDENPFGTGGNPYNFTDSNGYPTTIPANSPGNTNKKFRTGLFTAPGVTIPTGTYVLLYDGIGTIVLSGGVSNIAPSAGRIQFDVSGLFLLDITATNASPNHVRNIRIVPLANEGNYATTPFRAAFLSNWNRARVVRFLNWVDTNNQFTQWTDFSVRPVSTYYTWTSDFYGPPIEVMCDLCNRLQADMWLPVPHSATDAYLTSLIALIKTNLDPGLLCYVEHSNEVWNTSYPQNGYALQQANARGIAVGQTDAFKKQAYHGERSLEIFNLFTAGFSGQTHRVVNVLAGQWTNPSVIETSASWVHHTLGVTAASQTTFLSGSVDVGASIEANYSKSQYLSLDASGLLALLETTSEPDRTNASSIDYVYSFIGVNQSASNIYTGGRPPIAYEGGIHTSSYSTNDPSILGVIRSANRDAGSTQVVKDCIDQWFIRGGGLFMWYDSCTTYSNNDATPAPNGTYFGLKEYSEQSDATPKFAGWTTYIDANKVAVPSTVANLTATTGVTGQLILNWTVMTGATNVEIHYKLVAASLWTLATLTPKGNTISFNLNGIASTQSYNLRIRGLGNVAQDPSRLTRGEWSNTATGTSGGSGADASASGAIGTVTITTIGGSATGAAAATGMALSQVKTTTIDGNGHVAVTAQGSIGTITLTTPAGSSIGHTVALGSIPTLTRSGLTGSGTGGAAATGALVVLKLTVVSGFATGGVAAPTQTPGFPYVIFKQVIGRRKL